MSIPLPWYPTGTSNADPAVLAYGAITSDSYKSYLYHLIETAGPFIIDQLSTYVFGIRLPPGVMHMLLSLVNGYTKFNDSAVSNNIFTQIWYKLKSATTWTADTRAKYPVDCKIVSREFTDTLVYDTTFNVEELLKVTVPSNSDYDYSLTVGCEIATVSDLYAWFAQSTNSLTYLELIDYKTGPQNCRPSAHCVGRFDGTHEPVFQTSPSVPVPRPIVGDMSISQIIKTELPPGDQESVKRYIAQLKRGK